MKHLSIWFKGVIIRILLQLQGEIPMARLVDSGSKRANPKPELKLKPAISVTK